MAQKSCNKKHIELSRFISFDGQDIAVALHDLIKNYFGGQIIGLYEGHETALRLADIESGIRETKKAILGNFRIRKPFMADFWRSGSIIGCKVEEQNRQVVEEFFDKLQDHLQKNSLYKCKAITANREFLDISWVNENELAFPAAVQRELDAFLWSTLEKPKICLEFGLRRQRKIVLNGTFGAGKTMALLLTAKKGTENGWTFIALPPTSEWDRGAIERGLQFALLYQPVIFSVEDIDQEQRENDSYTIKQLLTAVDGFMSKGAEIVIVMTTNNPDKIAGAFQRPGRTDRIIRLGNLDPISVKRIFEITIPGSKLDPTIDWARVIDTCNGYPPAFVRESAIGASLMAISHGEEKVGEVRLLEAIKSLRGQYEACKKALGFNS